MEGNQAAGQSLLQSLQTTVVASALFQAAFHDYVEE
jgi:hypothetical protein